MAGAHEGRAFLVKSGMASREQKADAHSSLDFRFHCGAPGQVSACPAAHAPPTTAVPAVPAVPAAIWSARDKLRAVRGGAPRRPPLVPAHLRVRGGAPRRPPLVPAHLRVRGARHRFPSAPRAEGSPSLPILPGLRILRVPLRARLSSGGGHAAPQQNAQRSRKTGGDARAPDYEHTKRAFNSRHPCRQPIA